MIIASTYSLISVSIKNFYTKVVFRKNDWNESHYEIIYNRIAIQKIGFSIISEIVLSTCSTITGSCDYKSRKLLGNARLESTIIGLNIDFSFSCYDRGYEVMN